MSLQDDFEKRLASMSNDEKDHILTNIALILDRVKEGNVEGSYSKDQAFDRIATIFKYDR